MMKRDRISAEELRTLLHYDPETGIFRHRVARSGVRGAGTIAGNISDSGYHRIGLRWRLYRSHHLAWLYVHGAWPQQEIDHINGVRTDNRITNLRLATRSQQTQNSLKTSSAPFRGVARARSKFMARVWLEGKCHFLGRYDTAHHAAAVAKLTRMILFGRFEREAE